MTSCFFHDRICLLYICTFIRYPHQYLTSHYPTTLLLRADFLLSIHQLHTLQYHPGPIYTSKYLPSGINSSLSPSRCAKFCFIYSPFQEHCRQITQYCLMLPTTFQVPPLPPSPSVSIISLPLTPAFQWPLHPNLNS